MNKPRNHVILALLQRKSGSGVHVKSEKSQRQKNRRRLQKELNVVKICWPLLYFMPQILTYDQ